MINKNVIFPAAHNFHINAERLLSTIEKSAEIGKLPNGGLCRLALSDQDRQMRDLFNEWMKESGLEVRVDDVGNMYGRREGKNSNAPPIVIGSHLDTQKVGGKYDGILGVLGALEVIRTLNDHKIETRNPIEIVNFTNEEGARFLPSMLGSHVLANDIHPEELVHIKDKDDVRFLDELKRIGYRGSEKNRLKELLCYVELHIEQGPILEDNEKTIGIVTGLQGICTLEVTVKGKTSHAGTTPMDKRRDAVLVAAKMIQELHQSAKNVSDLMMTIGKLQAYPNVTNSLAEHVVFTIDVRHPDDKVREQFVRQTKEKLGTIALVEKLDIYMKELVDVQAERFSSEMMEELERITERLGYRSMKLISGAGHDAQNMNKLAPSGMIFIPSIGGVSHSEEEFSKKEHIVQGVQVLFELVLKLANEKNHVKR